jgi:hypothetical protein
MRAAHKHLEDPDRRNAMANRDKQKKEPKKPKQPKKPGQKARG